MAAKALSPEMRARVLALKVKHDSTYGSSGIPRPGMTAPASPIEAVGYPHPILRTVPTTGEEAIFLGRRTNGYVMGLPLDESEALLNELWAHATQPQFCYQHKWQVGQVVVWDNRMMLHMRTPFDETKARFMWRTQTKGEAVVPPEPDRRHRAEQEAPHVTCSKRLTPHQHRWRSVSLGGVAGQRL